MLKNIRLKTKGGFTLVEVIISIGILAILSSSILELFITAGNLNRRAFDMDKSVAVIETTASQFKQLKNPEDIKDMPILENACEIEGSNGSGYRIFLDKNWEVIQTGQSKSSSDTTLFEKSSFIFNINFNSIGESGLVKMNLSVIKNKFGYMEKKSDKNFYEVTITKYFGVAKAD